VCHVVQVDARPTVVHRLLFPSPQQTMRRLLLNVLHQPLPMEGQRRSALDASVTYSVRF
jgi:hypothetical protein